MNNYKPLIGVTPMYDIPNQKWFIQLQYMRHLEANGAIPVMIPPTEKTEVLEGVFNKVDGILLTGGQDVSPSLYGEETLSTCESVVSMRDTIDFFLTEKSKENDKPLFGICRGIQVINAAFGGTLYQDIPSMVETDVNHRPGLPEPDSIAHEIIFNDKSPTFNLLEKERFSVNSFHHQAIKKIAPGMEITAFSEDGIPEEIVFPGKRFIRAVQWHPEKFSTGDLLSRTLFSSFISACR